MIKLDAQQISAIENLCNSKGVKLDGVGVFFARDLESIDPADYWQIEEDLTYAEDIPVNSGKVGPADDSYTFRVMDRSAIAKLYKDYGDDIPFAQLSAEEYTKKAYVYVNGFLYSVDEIRKANAMGKALDRDGVATAVRGHEEAWNEAAYKGIEEVGTTGLLNDANVSVTAAPNGTAGTATFATKTFLEVQTDVRNAITRLRVNSRNKITADSCIMGQTPYEVLAGKFMDTGNATNITWKQALESMFNITIKSRPVMNYYFVGGTKDGMVVYQKSPRFIEFLSNFSPIPYAPQQENLTFKTILESKLTGTVIRYPLAFDITTGI